MAEVLYPKESYAIMGACFSVYNEKGCGFLEAVYQECLEIELERQRIPFIAQKELCLTYRGRQLRQTSRALQSQMKLFASIRVIRGPLPENLPWSECDRTDPRSSHQFRPLPETAIRASRALQSQMKLFASIRVIRGPLPENLPWSECDRTDPRSSHQFRPLPETAIRASRALQSQMKLFASIRVIRGLLPENSS